MFSNESPFAALRNEYVSLANCPKSFSWFRLHFMLCLGSWMEKALCLPLTDVQVGLASLAL